MNYVLITLGAICLVLGIVGMFLPVLPTTPFLLLTAFLWAKSSRRLHTWLLNHRYLGTYIRNFQEQRALTLRVKVISLTTMWASMIFCTFGPLRAYPWIGVGLMIISVLVTWHILRFKTLKD